MGKMTAFTWQQRGQALVEYALLLCLVSITAIIALTSIGQKTFNYIASVIF